MMNDMIKKKMVDIILDDKGLDITDLVRDMVYNGLHIIEICHYMNMPQEDVREIIALL